MGSENIHDRDSVELAYWIRLLCGRNIPLGRLPEHWQ
jgi:hypothetical protein